MIIVKRKLSSEEVDEMVKHFRKAIEDAEDFTIQFSVGIVHRDNFVTGYRESEPTNGRTIHIEINGGAQEVEGPPIFGGSIN